MQLSQFPLGIGDDDGVGGRGVRTGFDGEGKEAGGVVGVGIAADGAIIVPVWE